ncbi:aladin-like [Camellia sinensis]|uniref:aladin-like n=1 Tax=Camellia sinensis TaxID=4442 RepID=UPI00103554E8|nr:aladin-like [Camellia sinensis]
MYSFPQPGSVTICEINRDFITAENLSDDRAKETYAKVLGIVFSAVSFRTDHLLPSPNPEQGSEQLGRIDESVQRNSWSAALQGIFINSLKLLFHPNDVQG